MSDQVPYRHRTADLNLAVALVSGATLGLEILYVRLVSILLYPVATYLVISLALLGLGAGAGYLSLRRKSQVGRHIPAGASLGFAMALLASLVVIWYAGGYPAAALALPIALGVPMFFSGLALSAAFSLPGIRVPILYAADLTGAGISAGLVLIGLNYLGGITIGIILAALGVLSASLFADRRNRRWLAAMILPTALLLALSSRLPFGVVPVSPKELRLATQLGPQVVWEYQGWSPLARVDVLSIPGDRLADELPIPYKLVTHDGGAPSLLLGLQGPEQEQALLARTIFGVPYWIHDEPSVLVIGLGGGPDIVAALSAGSGRILGAEVNPEMVSIVEERFSDFTGDPYHHPAVEIQLIDGRHMMARSSEQFDIVQLTGVDTTVATLGGNPNLAENYLYTSEAFIEYIAHLTSDGTLSVSFPNVDGLGLRLVALAAEALEHHGLGPIRDHVVVSEMTGYIHVLVKRSPFAQSELALIEDHYSRRPSSVYFPLYNRLFGQPGPDFIRESRVLYSPGHDVQANVYSEFLNAVEAGFGQEYLDAQPQMVRPPTDNWPFFFVLDKLGGSSPNYETLFLTLILLGIFSIILTLVPPLALRRGGLSVPHVGLLAIFFACLGLGFIFVEVTFIQRLSLIVGHPSYSLGLTLTGLLISSGAGSLLSARLRWPAPRRAAMAAIAVAVLTMIGHAFLELFGGWMLTQGFFLRMGLATATISVPGFFMGVPFPSGLSLVKDSRVDFVPWAWGINAAFTVIGTVLALLLAMSSGFGMVLWLAAGLYISAALAILEISRRGAYPVG